MTLRPALLAIAMLTSQAQVSPPHLSVRVLNAGKGEALAVILPDPYFIVSSDAPLATGQTLACIVNDDGTLTCGQSTLRVDGIAYRDLAAQPPTTHVQLQEGNSASR